jgi:hypothetical protein
MARHNKIEAHTYAPDPSMQRIAAERTYDILRAWSWHVSFGPVDFKILAESCYMQGLHDMLDAIEQRGLMVIQREAPDVWEGYCG